MKVLVTGSNGLLGTALKELLGEGHIYHTRKDADLTNEKSTNDYITHHVNLKAESQTLLGNSW